MFSIGWVGQGNLIKSDQIFFHNKPIRDPRVAKDMDRVRLSN
jgi:hypothetical protein